MVSPESAAKPPPATTAEPCACPNSDIMPGSVRQLPGTEAWAKPTPHDGVASDSLVAADDSAVPEPPLGSVRTEQRHPLPPSPSLISPPESDESACRLTPSTSSMPPSTGPSHTTGSLSHLPLKKKVQCIQFELSIDPSLGLLAALRQANECFGLPTRGTPHEQAAALLCEMGV